MLKEGSRKTIYLLIAIIAIAISLPQEANAQETQLLKYSTSKNADQKQYEGNLIRLRNSIMEKKDRLNLLDNLDDSIRIEDYSSIIDEIDASLTKTKDENEVKFTLGIISSSNNEMHPIQSIRISTSFMGDLIAKGLELLDSGAVNNYIATNISVKSSIPFKGDAKFDTHYGVGLGQINIFNGKLYPAINMLHIDTADSRIADTLISLDSVQGAWSQFSLGLAFESDFFFNKLGLNLQSSMINFSFDFPYYYPGNPISAIAAVFSGNMKKYEKSGDIRYSVGVTIPIL